MDWFIYDIGLRDERVKCSIDIILQFRTEYFHTGYQHSTIAGFRSTIPAYYDPVGVVAVVKKSREAALWQVFIT